MWPHWTSIDTYMGMHFKSSSFYVHNEMASGACTFIAFSVTQDSLMYTGYKLDRAGILCITPFVLCYFRLLW